MAGYVVRRVVQAVFVLLGVSLVSFILVASSGDPAALLLPLEASAEDVARLRASLGLDAPHHIQYIRHIARAMQGDFGRSITFREPALDVVLERLPATIQLALVAFVLAMIVAVPLGVVSALRPNGAVDRMAMGFALFGQSIPIYWLGMMLILVFAVLLGWLPTGGRGGGLHLIMPTLTLAMYSTARTARMVRSTLLEVLSEDYVRTARAKGLSELRIVAKHGLKNAALPVLTVLGLDLGNLLGGAVITESIFAWPGLGRLAVQAIYARDYPIVQTVVIVSALSYIVINLGIDVLYAWLDPRVRYE